MSEVSLSKREIVMGAECGIMRNLTSLHRPDSYGFSDEHGWNAHIEGACGEIAVAKLLGRYWSPSVNTFSAPDIGLNIQVRTRSRHDYELIVREKDEPEHAYVLVTGKAPAFIVRGYCLGSDARQKEWLQEHGGRPPAWFVPQASLWPWRDLRYSEPKAPTREAAA